MKKRKTVKMEKLLFLLTVNLCNILLLLLDALKYSDRLTHAHLNIFFWRRVKKSNSESEGIHSFLRELSRSELKTEA